MKQHSNLNSVMETGDHFKNGAGTKSQMIGKNYRLSAIAWLISMMAFCLIISGCTNSTQNKSGANHDIPVFDLTKNYPEMELTADEDDKEYILLETKDNVLADADFSIEYLSDQYIVGKNRRRGDIFIFDKDGKVVSFFNHTGQGPSEYTFVYSLAFDEKTQEIFISDQPSKNQCLVYSIDGSYLRQFNYPENSTIWNLYDFDEQTLLAYNSLSPVYNGEMEINQITPYVFLSKKDGSLISRLDLSFPNRLPDIYRQVAGQMQVGLPLGFGGNLKYENEFVIVNRSTDTVYLLTKDNKLNPLFVRTPSVYDENIVLNIFVTFKTNTYLFFESTTFNFEEDVKRMLNSQPNVRLTQKFAYNMQKNQLFHINKESKERPMADVYGRYEVFLYRADQLVDRLEKGELDGKLKQIAQKIDAEDNPVVEIIRYKI